ncbi:MAG TPA: hypothetical protein VMU71_09540 [Terracidiphilus sp.]|nr:hypothetical protein [Terracidiphilus sp.]
MAERIARLTLALQGWTGWSRRQPAPQTETLEARCGQVLGPAEFGLGAPDAEAVSRVFGCQIRLMTLLGDRAIFEHQRLVVKNPDGTVNLSAPATGTFQLRPGQHIELATPTMDGGLNLTVALSAIEESASEAGADV